MIVEIPVEEKNVAAPLVQEPVLIMKDVDLVHVGGGMSGACHF